MMLATIPVDQLVATPPAGIDPVMQGWLAARAGRGISANFYAWGTAARHDWYQGYWRWRLDPAPFQLEDVVPAAAGSAAAADRDESTGGPEGAPPASQQKGWAALEAPDASGKEAAVGSVDGGIPAPVGLEERDDIDPAQRQLDVMEGEPGDDENADGPSLDGGSDLGPDPRRAQDRLPAAATAQVIPSPGRAVTSIRPRAPMTPPALDRHRQSVEDDRRAIDRAIAAGKVRVLPAIETLGSLPLCDTEDQAIAELTRLGRRVRKTGRRQFTLDGRSLDFEGLRRAARYAVRMEAAWKKGAHP